ncbi:glutamate racemase [Acinetobacter sp. ANC 4558]|uniref:glutamate racemase n=1 Tax=Acinetobacter sp. ANC 4558 TaxID=1977876 RepID=UPI000A32EC85|nr:glutamate racemase [Acinetobacter sp. ANC 4558]OTG85255.1 glutamate racemase [Acinetobacter sp. ANC 4558]
MYSLDAPIGVIDSGVGGLTSVKEILNLLPGENIIYCGDNLNAPYGNRSADEIIALTKKMLNFLQSKNVKLVAVACNTISSTFESKEYEGYEKNFNFPILSVIEPAAEDVIRQHYKSVGVIATEFTIQTGCHKQLIQKMDPTIQVYGEPSKNLAMLIEQGDLNNPAIHNDIKQHIANLLSQHPLKEIVLGCTHYPIVQNIFESIAPNIKFINPARDQAISVKKHLKLLNILNPNISGTLEINTSGTSEIYTTILNELEINKDYSLNIIEF